MQFCHLYFFIHSFKQKTMLDSKVIVNVLLALVIFKVISRLFLDSAFDSILPASYEAE